MFGLLGPNGAGKTTTVEILEGYRRRDAGDVACSVWIPSERGAAGATGSAIVLQSSAMYPEPHRRRACPALRRLLLEAPRDVDEVVTLVGLDEKRNARVKTLSGGQRRRLDLALGAVGDPELLFLDEPTTGFDPAARRAAWDMIRSLRALGKTVLLTTHYLDEAEQLADRVAVFRAGQDRRARAHRASYVPGGHERRFAIGSSGSEIVIQHAGADARLHELRQRHWRPGRELRTSRCGDRALEDIYLVAHGGRGGAE